MVLGREGLSAPCVRPTHNVEGFSCTQWEKQGNARAVHLLEAEEAAFFYSVDLGRSPATCILNILRQRLSGCIQV